MREIFSQCFAHHHWGNLGSKAINVGFQVSRTGLKPRYCSGFALIEFLVKRNKSATEEIPPNLSQTRTDTQKQREIGA